MLLTYLNLQFSVPNL